MPFVVDRLLPGDLDEALRLSTQAGWNQTPADWRRVLDLCPDGCLAGRLDGRLAATASVASIGSVRWIGMVLVDESLRGRGYGSTMLAQAIDLARAGGASVGLDASDLGRPVYLKLGFHDVAPIDRWAGTLRAAGPEGNIGAFEALTAEAALPLDPIERPALLRRLMTEPGTRLVVSPGLGFALLRNGRVASHVGPLVAANDAVAVALLDRLAELTAGRTVFIDALRSEGTTALLEARGLTVARRLTRMTLEAPQPLLMDPRVRAALSFEWG